MEQSRAEQSRAEQSRAEQSRAEQSRAEQSRAEQSRAEQNKKLAFFMLWPQLTELGDQCDIFQGQVTKDDTLDATA
jgi:uncharacterized protein YdaU (DUF1376 family)